MWLAEDGRRQAGPEPFDHGYRRELAGETIDHDRENRANTFMQLVGDPAGKSVLDLGGGLTLLDRIAGRARLYALLDFSPACCEAARKRLIEMGASYVLYPEDVTGFLLRNGSRFDMTLCFGLIYYLPAGSLDLLLERCPSEVLCLSTTLGGGYLKYETRLVGYGLDDLQKAADRHGWRVVEKIASSDQYQARWERK